VSFDLQVAIEIKEESQTGQARRRAQTMAVNAGLSHDEANNVSIIASEAATNLVKHGGGGEILLRELISGIEVLAIDTGRGMADPSKCLADGYSTVGTAGTGLGAIRRLSSVFDIYSRAGGGTALVSRLRHGAPSKRLMDIGVVNRPKVGETFCGDAWVVKEVGNEFWVVVADGLGHGPDASEAAQEAIRMFRETSGHKSTTDALEAMHGALRKTRGAAVAVAQIDRTAGQVRFAGVGNVAGTIVGPGTWKSMMSHNGILGHELRRIQEFSHPWIAGSKLVMNSDGLSTWSMDKYPGLLMRHPSLMAGVLYRDHWRRRDDVTVFVAQEKQAA
jgi:anti-sigma regulatory factor (Ser/Thr protein kinase)